MTPTKIYGNLVDDQTRCTHYHTALDIIAIKFKCCGKYYPCYTCHEEVSDHPSVTWKANEQETIAIICGICKHEMSIKKYLESQDQCPSCMSNFNPKCSNHHNLYFKL